MHTHNLDVHLKLYEKADKENGGIRIIINGELENKFYTPSIGRAMFAEKPFKYVTCD